VNDDPGWASAPTPLERALQELLSGSALTAFRLNGQYLSVAERLARPSGLTAAWWQVLGAVLEEPLSVAGIARAMGITRQSVQRIADLLVERGLATYEPNPAHRRAKLVAPTEEGRAAVARISPGHAEFAARLAEELGGEAEFAEVLAAQERLAAALESLEQKEARKNREATTTQNG
jgi:DNA-binding MarR family transcriptional regulator